VGDEAEEVVQDAEVVDGLPVVTESGVLEERSLGALAPAQVAALWRPADGDLAQFVRDQFVADAAQLDATFARFETALESIDGHLLEIWRDVRIARIVPRPAVPRRTRRFRSGCVT